MCNTDEKSKSALESFERIIEEIPSGVSVRDLAATELFADGLQTEIILEGMKQQMITELKERFRAFWMGCNVAEVLDRNKPIDTRTKEKSLSTLIKFKTNHLLSKKEKLIRRIKELENESLEILTEINREFPKLQLQQENILRKMS